MQIVRFAFSNFMSFKEEQEIFFSEETRFSSARNHDLIEPIAIKDKEKLLPVIAIYGKNASGKSNALIPFILLQALLDLSQKNKEAIGIYYPFFGSNEPSKISIDFIVDNNLWFYNLTYNNNEILYEELFKKEKSRKKLIYIRKNNVIEKYNDKIITEINKKNIENDFLKSRPYLTVLEVLYILEKDEIKNILKSIKEKMYIPRNILFFQIFINNMETLYKDKELLNKVINAIKEVDFGIENIFIEERKYVGASSNYTAEFKHINGYKLGIQSQSSGTQTFFHYLPKMFQFFESGGILVIDEIETNLHPMLVEKIIAMFHDKNINKAGAQLLFTTHNTNLMDSSVLARDEIWIADKNENGESSLYPLSEFRDIRKNKNIEKDYLDGRFGGIPYLENFENAMAKIMRDSNGEKQ